MAVDAGEQARQRCTQLVDPLGDPQTPPVLEEEEGQCHQVPRGRYPREQVLIRNLSQIRHPVANLRGALPSGFAGGEEGGQPTRRGPGFSAVIQNHRENPGQDRGPGMVVRPPTPDAAQILEDPQSHEAWSMTLVLQQDQRHGGLAVQFHAKEEVHFELPLFFRDKGLRQAMKAIEFQGTRNRIGQERAEELGGQLGASEHGLDQSIVFAGRHHLPDSGESCASGWIPKSSSESRGRSRSERLGQVGRKTRRQGAGRPWPRVLRPDGTGECRVIHKSGNHMPMQVGHHVPQTRQVHFGRFQDPSESPFDTQDQIEQTGRLVGGEVRHLGHMTTVDHPTKSWVVGIVHQHHPMLIVLEERGNRERPAKLTGRHGAETPICQWKKKDVPAVPSRDACRHRSPGPHR